MALNHFRANRPHLKNLSFYCIYPRNHSESGTFQSIIDDLPRLVFTIFFPLLMTKNTTKNIMENLR